VRGGDAALFQTTVTICFESLRALQLTKKGWDSVEKWDSIVLFG